MLKKTIGFLPPCSRGPGLSALYFGLAEQIAKSVGPLVCEIPSWLSFPQTSSSLIKISFDHDPSAPARFVFLTEECRDEFSALIAVTRPINSDLVWLRSEMSRWADQPHPPKVTVLLWTEDYYEPIPLNSFFSSAVRTVALATQDLVKAENSRRWLSEFKANIGVMKMFRELAEEINAEVNQAPSLETESRIDFDSFQCQVRERFWASVEGMSAGENNKEALEKLVDRVLEITYLENKKFAPPAGSLARVRRSLLQEITGLGPLEDLMEDPSITEIMVNGPASIFIERDGRIVKSDIHFQDQKQLRGAIDRMVGRMGRRVDTASPLCDVKLPSGARVNIVLPPLAPDGPMVTIRRFRDDVRSMDDLIRLKAVTADQAEALRRAVQTRANLLIAGNTGSGKTTLLNALAGFINADERIITLEDAAELKLPQPHVIRLETRPKNIEGAGEIKMSDLVVNALRMRPDRLIIGECRGSEVIPMLQAMNTGHDGSMTTIHANSASDALRRLESMVLLGAPEWPLEAVRQQIAAGLDCVVYLRRTGAERKLIEIGKFLLINGDLRFVPEMRWEVA